ncbi:hypothetical protein H113_06103 [Trichophyton rubrum MR1459]|nr:hypothetical protein H113_06103 [Trichophyton rubrum MR1459]KMQ43711.1 Chitin-binding, type 1 [Trichophyton rubrum]
MRSSVSCVSAALLWGASWTYAAINLNGSQAVLPLSEHDPSPIGDPTTYYPDQHDCPLPCVDYANIHSWIPYFSVDRLRRCQEPLLVQLSVTQPLDDLESTILLRTCTSSSNISHAFAAKQINNPKKSEELYQRRLDTAPVCVTTGIEVQDRLKLAIGSNNERNSIHTTRLLAGMEKFFSAKDNCDENFLFAYYNETAVGLYIGPGLGKPTAKSALSALSSYIRTRGAVSNTAVQLCGDNRKSDRVFGIYIDTTGDLTAVQKTVSEWSKGNCMTGLKSLGDLADVKVMDIAGMRITSGNDTTNNGTHDSTHSHPRLLKIRHNLLHTNFLGKRDVCRYIQIMPGDSCTSLSMRCGIRGADFLKFNPKQDLCATLQPNNYICCSAGDPYTPPTPKPDPDGTCASHIVQNGDSCDAIARKYRVTVADLENWNKAKTWAWTECKDILVGYKICISDGSAPMPAPQEGAECGPLVPGTQKPTNKSISLADLNPCPLKSCCSNWGYCGVFPGHCTINAPEGGGPGSKKKGYENTCVSNCGNEIKQNSGPPASFQRIGYYEAYNLKRNCLKLKAKDANTDGSYTHMHWGFAEIDPNTFKPIIKESKEQWEEFKALPNVKRIVSFGGWAYSTDAATYNILRSAIITNRDTFASNLAQFAEDEGIDGIDIDWEYPGAPDITVGGKPIGEKRDGLSYLRFLTVLKQKMGPDKSVSIAAPASFWYLKAFPIDTIARAIDYIVYMTYDLHGQWDYGNANAFDMCPSGKCIRSHVNLTETRNALSMITKAGVPNNKIFVGESSYGRSFHMVQDGCWGPLCEFTGSRTQSDAQPGRCTKTAGYISFAEINEIIKRGDGVNVFHDDASNTDVMLYKGDYISYMTPVTKDTRRADWKDLNFAGSIDWAVDLQSFTSTDYESTPERASSGMGCIRGGDKTLDTGSLCEYSCYLGFCPESLCTCLEMGPLRNLPKEHSGVNVVAEDENDVEMTRLCIFSCKYGFCPGDICITPVDWSNDGPEMVGDNPDAFNTSDARWQNSHRCFVYKDAPYDHIGLEQCSRACKPEIDAAKEAGRMYNVGCLGFWPLEKEVPWVRDPSSMYEVADGMCLCDSVFLNELATTFLEALPAIGQIGCYILLSTIKLVIDIGTAIIPPAGRAISAGLDAVMTAAQLASYVYSETEDPAGAFEWWLSPCGGSDLVPDDLKKAFDILSGVAEGISSFRKPKNIGRGSGKKGDEGNPRTPTQPRPKAPTKPKPTGPKKKRCYIPPIVRKRCASAEPRIQSECSHVSPAEHSAIRVNPHWATLTCPPEAAVTANDRKEGSAVAAWSSQHSGAGWQDGANRAQTKCQRDEYPPAYFLGPNDPARTNSGLNAQGQLIRWLPGRENGGGGQIWSGACFIGPVKALSDQEFRRKVERASGVNRRVLRAGDLTQTMALVDIPTRPEFSFTSWGHSANPPYRDGLEANPCWPSGIAALDPGFTLLTFDPFYNGQSPPYDYKAPYVKGSNGS